MLPDGDGTGMCVGFPACTRSCLGFLFCCCDENAVLGMTHSLSATLPTGARQAGSRVRGASHPDPACSGPGTPPSPPPLVAQMWGAVPGPEPSGIPVRSPYHRLAPQHTAVLLIRSVIGLNVLGASQRVSVMCVTIGCALKTGNHASADNSPFLIPQEPMCTPHVTCALSP